MNSLQFKKNEFKKLCAIIGHKPVEVEKLILDIDNYYHEWIEKKTNKKTGEFKTYRDGTVKQRIIRPSLNDLKAIQKNIKNRILSPIPLPNNVHGGVKKRSNITNAKPHQGNKFQFTTDLQEFYPNINHQRVYETFMVLGFSHHYSHWLTKLTTWKYELPQGTPTSTHISNLVFLETDKKLIELSNLHGLTYTRYVDDLTFSSQKDFRHLLNEILDIVISGDFKLSYRKTQYSGNQTITGIDVFLNKIDAPEKIIEKSKLEIASNLDIKPYTVYLNNIRKTNKKKSANS
ncbi:reverse transcriptase family protein [Pedobacter sp. UC225_61]|uniref:reverse transcriptase family protein n=1 Tax=Pedobacter sp. UC225_61 TaxID=3374623 RepID=UPI0037A2D73C